jgi:hypothetical protein
LGTRVARTEHIGLEFFSGRSLSGRVRTSKQVRKNRASAPDIGGRRHTGETFAAPTVISRNELLSRRLISQNSSAASGARDVATTVRRLFATQSQDFAQSLWGVGLRTPGAHRSGLLAAMASGAIVRSSSLRGTVMMVAAEDPRGILSLTAERTVSSGCSPSTESYAGDRRAEPGSAVCLWTNGSVPHRFLKGTSNSPGGRG